MNAAFCPRFVCGDIDLTLEYPTRPHIPRRGGVGGSETSAAGIPASYVVRRDRLLVVPLRFTEEEWLDFEDLLDEMMTHPGTTAFYADAEDLEPTNLCYLESPKEGDEWEPTRTDEMAGEYEFTIVLRSMTGRWDVRYFAEEDEES